MNTLIEKILAISDMDQEKKEQTRKIYALMTKICPVLENEDTIIVLNVIDLLKKFYMQKRRNELDQYTAILPEGDLCTKRI